MIPLIKKKTKKDKNDKKNRIDAAIFLSSIIEVVLVFCIIILFYFNKPLTSSKVIFIPQGSTNYIITYLNKSGYDLNILDKIAIKLNGYPQSGWIDLKSEYMTKADFIKKLLTSKAAIRGITLIPGETYYFFLKDIAKKFNLSYDELKIAYDKYAYKLDGNILAETYNLPLGMKEDHIIYYLTTYTNRKYKEFSNKIFGEYNKKSWYRYVTIASIIQKEAANIEEMPIVSSVIQNRLKKKMPLQMDGTLNYGKFSHTKITPKMIRENKSSYNTYKYADLPKHPVAAVSLDSLKAAIFPAKTDFLYFVRDRKTGDHIFAKTYREHVNNINRTNYRKIKKKVTPKKQIPAKKPTPKKETDSIKNLWKSVN